MGFKEYTPEEILEFRRKDKRISLSGIVQVILAREKTNVGGVEEVVAQAKKYSDMIWEVAESSIGGGEEPSKGFGVKGETEKSTVESEVRDLSGLTKDEQKVMEVVWNEAKNITWPDLLEKVKKEFGMYPSKMSSVKKVLVVLQDQ